MRAYLNSLRFKMFASILFMIVPLVIVIIVNSIYSVGVVRNQVAQSNKNLLSLYMNEIDRNLNEVDKYLFDFTENDTDLIGFQLPRQNNETTYMMSKLRLFNTIMTDVSVHRSIDLFFVYSITNGELIMTQQFGSSFEERDATKQEIMQMLQGEPGAYSGPDWHVWEGRNHNYALLRLIRSGEVYVGAWVNSNKLMVPLNLIDLGESGAALLTTGELKPMSQSEMIEREGIELASSSEAYTITGKERSFLMMDESSDKGDFKLVALVPDDVIQQKLPFLQRVSSFITAGAVVFFVLFLFFIRYVFLKPMKQLVVAMRKTRDGHWDTRLHQSSTSTEFEIVNETFNRMIAEIRDLKIDVYEEKLNHQKSELQLLQLQINPHFFLNSLNIVYNLATVKDYKLIQEMSKCLVVYFRYMFRTNRYVVPLKEELLHTANYLRIQQLRFPGSLSSSIEMKDEVKEVEIPPLVIQTIVENTIKHAVDIDQPITIEVVAALLESDNGNRIVITIKDNGSGFPEEVLSSLHADEEKISEEGEHVGIWNIKRRLRLLYQSDAAITFENNQSGSGAIVTMSLPMPAVGHS
ncbi:two-component system, sensor histidine kinase YesM [Paenibacillus algorifonticola]|uniref:Two-component system, sensor histidine kinase YesM n=1 Tax=Paenibacillus algorifonticola TaxID=684063 RepID=A0A1I2GT92_9BACL|nr:histidine kinase [Paenibacillus algorifonticola]SFF20458.1 two-component system, sensor histidine kinase YesM [Paenibacillus algorifonticola]